MFRFEQLEIWKLAIEYGNRLYSVANTFPKTEIYALSDQLQRAGVSVSNNIAEGSGGTNREFRNYLNMSIKSALETVSILCFTQIRGYITEQKRMELYEEAEKLVRKTRAFKKSLK